MRRAAAPTQHRNRTTRTQRKKSDRFITKIDDDTVSIENRFGGRLISLDRLADLTFDDASNPQQVRPTAEFHQLFDAEIAEAN